MPRLAHIGARSATRAGARVDPQGPDRHEYDCHCAQQSRLARPAAAGNVCAAPPTHGFEDDRIELTLQARPQRCGREVRLIVTPSERGMPPPRESPALIEAVAQGHVWLDQLLRGEARSLRSIATSAGVSERYVSQAVRCAFLAPDLVEAVLQGRQPAQLTLSQIMKDLPLDWNEQRRRFGLAAAAPPRVALLSGL